MEIYAPTHPTDWTGSPPSQLLHKHLLYTLGCLEVDVQGGGRPQPPSVLEQDMVQLLLHSLHGLGNLGQSGYITRVTLKDQDANVFANQLSSTLSEVD